MGWGRIAVYASPGSFTFTVPSGITRIGAVIGSGGGSGGCGTVQENGYWCGATGGASGKMRVINDFAVTANQSIIIVVGAGGSVPTSWSGGYWHHYAPGNNGGQSSFNGIAIEGGEGANAASPTMHSLISIDPAVGGANGILGNGSTTNATSDEYYNPYDETYYQFCSGAGAAVSIDDNEDAGRSEVVGTGATAKNGTSANARISTVQSPGTITVSASTGMCSGGSSSAWGYADGNRPSRPGAAAGRPGFCYVYAKRSEMLLAGIPEV